MDEASWLLLAHGGSFMVVAIGFFNLLVLGYVLEIEFFNSPLPGIFKTNIPTMSLHSSSLSRVTTFVSILKDPRTPNEGVLGGSRAWNGRSQGPTPSAGKKQQMSERPSTIP
ncbi:unnamed protein product [Cuscuta europaea]|uniref:Uncharacterized protein n=1 Tax=Cuscuta europaea TaxID=41803 RepID=A0A9P0ZTY6_CUSEU|nr:unnamed protein product [Cuscuta europaea]